MKTPKRRHWRHFGVFIVNFIHISYIVLLFSLLTLNNGCAGAVIVNSETLQCFFKFLFIIPHVSDYIADKEFVKKEVKTYQVISLNHNLVFVPFSKSSYDRNKSPLVKNYPWNCIIVTINNKDQLQHM